MDTHTRTPNAPATTRPRGYHLVVSIDQSEAALDTETIDPSGGRPRQRKVSARPEALLEWATSLRPERPGARVAVCIEHPCANIISFLGQFDFIDLFPVNPVLTSHYRDSFHTARPKDDVTDAALIARFICERHTSLQPWRPASAEMRQLRAYLEHRRLLVDTVTKTTNRLTAALKAYYPQALELCGKRLDAPLACRFLERFPDLATLKATPATELRAFYYANACRRETVVEKRVAAAAIAVPITGDEGIVEPQREFALFLVKQLDLLRTGIARYERLVADIMAGHEDAALFQALPGAGPNLSARLLSTFGEDRSRYRTPESLQRYSGIAPVTKHCPTPNAKPVCRARGTRDKAARSATSTAASPSAPASTSNIRPSSNGSGRPFSSPGGRAPTTTRSAPERSATGRSSAPSPTSGYGSSTAAGPTASPTTRRATRRPSTRPEAPSPQRYRKRHNHIRNVNKNSENHSVSLDLWPQRLVLRERGGAFDAACELPSQIAVHTREEGSI